MALSIESIDHVVLNCSRPEHTCAWYERVLGMTKEVFGTDERVALTFGDQKLNIRPTGAPQWITCDVDAPGSLDLCFVSRTPTSDVAEVLRSHGVEIIDGPVQRTGARGSMTSVYCRDPEGNLVEIAHYG